MALGVKNPPANIGDKRHEFDPWWWGRSGGGHGNPCPSSSLDNPMDRGASWATVHGVAELGTTLATWHESAHTYLIYIGHHW